MADELPDKLNKLEITPLIPQVKLIDEHIPVSLNPFFDDGINTNNFLPSNSGDTISNTKGLICCEHLQEPCKSRVRRCSESIIDEFKLQESNLLSTKLYLLSTPRTTLKLNKVPMKKNCISVGRKVLLREPVLRVLQNCFDVKYISRRKRLASSECSASSSNSMSDFKELINECDNMLMDNVNFNSNLNSFDIQRKNLKKCNSVKVQNLNKDDFIPCHSDSMCNSIISTTSFVNAELSPLVPVRTSCSQQAASQHSCNHSQSNSITASNTLGTTDDVTIDELASYFDTLVHIPKKMSSMAEMMYI